MNNNFVPVSGILAMLPAASAQAGTLRCGGDIIIDDQLSGQFKEQILEQCGAPTDKNGDDWLYDRTDVGDGVYVLHFNDDGQLESIEEQSNIE
jgi:hypothetical protein